MWQSVEAKGAAWARGSAWFCFVFTANKRRRSTGELLSRGRQRDGLSRVCSQTEVYVGHGSHSKLSSVK